MPPTSKLEIGGCPRVTLTADDALVVLTNGDDRWARHLTVYIWPQADGLLDRAALTGVLDAREEVLVVRRENWPADLSAFRGTHELAHEAAIWGYGIHRCVGARLAELQIRILLEEMAVRRLRVNVVEAPERVSACFVHGYRKMMVELSKY